eukprot:jgi/Ulvmu1/6869/UM031_0074.1
MNIVEFIRSCTTWHHERSPRSYASAENWLQEGRSAPVAIGTPTAVDRAATGENQPIMAMSGTNVGTGAVTMNTEAFMCVWIVSVLLTLFAYTEAVTFDCTARFKILGICH